MDFLCILVWCTISMSMVFPSVVHSDPIKIDFSVCQSAAHRGDVPPDPTVVLPCCPPKPTKPIIDGVPLPSTNFTRVRKASHCTDAAYAKKLEKAYGLMRALPDDDPRSLTQQWHTHCSYCGGSFLTSNNSNVTQGIDIHYSWLFFPWHRLFLFFHERILQSLLGDPTFSLSYWNWDSPGHGEAANCVQPGHNFPAPYIDSSLATYDTNRSENAKGNGRLHFPDLAFLYTEPATQQPLYNASAAELIASNLNVMYQAMVRGGTTSETFMGHPYRAGDPEGSRLAFPIGSGGTLETGAHSSVHLWTGHDPPVTFNDMGDFAYSARDPVFYVHHANIDRLWQVWKSIGPSLGQTREDYSDPDFLDAELLFYDENKDLRRVKVKEALDTVKLGYTYQKANDEAWILLNQTRCSNLDYADLITQAERLPVPIQDSDGYFHLEADTPFILVIDTPANPLGVEEFLTIGGIKLNRSRNAGFDVFVDLLTPSSHNSPWRCAEYSGRFANMAQRPHPIKGVQTFAWKESISRTLLDIQAPPSAPKLVVTLLPFSQQGDIESIKFTSITIDTSPVFPFQKSDMYKMRD